MSAAPPCRSSFPRRRDSGAAPNALASRPRSAWFGASRDAGETPARPGAASANPARFCNGPGFFACSFAERRGGRPPRGRSLSLLRSPWPRRRGRSMSSRSSARGGIEAWLVEERSAPILSLRFAFRAAAGWTRPARRGWPSSRRDCWMKAPATSTRWPSDGARGQRYPSALRRRTRRIRRFVTNPDGTARPRRRTALAGVVAAAFRRRRGGARARPIGARPRTRDHGRARHRPARLVTRGVRRSSLRAPVGRHGRRRGRADPRRPRGLRARPLRARRPRRRRGGRYRRGRTRRAARFGLRRAARFRAAFRCPRNRVGGGGARRRRTAGAAADGHRSGASAG